MMEDKRGDSSQLGAPHCCATQHDACTHDQQKIHYTNKCQGATITISHTCGQTASLQAIIVAQPNGRKPEQGKGKPRSRIARGGMTSWYRTVGMVEATVVDRRHAREGGHININVFPWPKSFSTFFSTQSINRLRPTRTHTDLSILLHRHIDTAEQSEFPLLGSYLPTSPPGVWEDDN